MENLSHSRQPNILSKKTCNGSSNKPAYDDVFGGPTLSPRIEDYSEIFGGFRSSRASSIPVLDVPLVDDDAAEVLFDVRSSGFDYGEVFGGLNGDDFAVSFEELVMMMEQSNGQSDSSDDEAWTPAEADNLSLESDRSTKEQCLSNGDSHESIDEGVEFKLSYNKASGTMDEDFSNGVLHIAQHHDVSGYTFAVDKSISLVKMEDECKFLEENDVNYRGEILRGKHLKKVKSHPANGSPDGYLLGNGTGSHREFSRNSSLPSEMFVTISDVSLRTQPSDLPPPSRPPPPLDDKRGDSGKATSTFRTAASEEAAAGCSSPYFDVEVDANSSAAVSAAAMKDAMEKAQAQLKTAKESMVKRREGFQTRTVLNDERKGKEEKIGDLFNGSGSMKDERGHISYQREDNGMEFIVLEEKQDIRTTTKPISDTVEGKKHLNVLKASAEENYGRESLSSEGSDSIDEAGEWKEATQFFELVTNKSRKHFGHEDNENILVPDSDFHDHQKEKNETVEVIQQLNQQDKKVKAVRAYHQLKQSEEKSHVSKESFEHEKTIRISEKKNKHKLDKKLQVAQEASRQAGSENKHETYQQPIEAVRKPTRADVSMKHENSLEVQQKESAAIGHSIMHEDKGSWSKEDEKEDGERKPRKAFQLKENEKKLPPCLELAEDERRLKKSPDQEEKEVMKAVHKQEEIKKLQRETYKREDDERRLKETVEKEEEDRKLKQTLEEEDRQRRRREAVEREEKEKKEIEAREREKNERQREACEREESEKKLKEALEKEEKERLLKETLEKQERHRVLRETVEKEGTAKHKRENEMRLKEGLKKEDRQRKQIEAARLEENVRREREEKEKRLTAARKKEDNERRIEDLPEQEDNGKGRRKPLEREENEKRQKDNYEKEESVMRCRASVEEETEQRMKEVPESIVGERMEEVCKQQENCLPSRVAQEIKGSETVLKVDDKPEEIREVSHAESKCEEARKLLVGTVENGKKKGLSKTGKDQIDLGKACKLDEDTNHQTAQIHDKPERNCEKLEATEEMVCDEIGKKLNERRNVERGSASSMFQGNLENERSSFPVVNFTSIEQKANDKTSSSSQEDSDVRSQEKKFAYQKSEKGKNMEQIQVPVNHGNNKDNFMPPKAVREPADTGKKLGGAQPVMLEVKGSASRIAQQVNSSQNTERKVNNSYETISLVDKEAERLKREAELERERLRKVEEEREREREREKDRMAVDRSTLATRERAFAERATAEARQRTLNEARERLEKACAEAREKTLPDKASAEARIRAERAAVERATAEARERAFEKAMAERATSESRERIERSVSDKFSASSRNGGVKPSSSSSDLQDLQSQGTGSFSGSRYQYSSLNSGAEGESPQRCKARLERYRRTAERAAKALAEKNMRDLLAQREQAERHRLAETLDADVKRWSSGKEGNLRALLSTLQYILGPDSGWQPIPLTEVITAAAVKKAYRKATLCVHPDKLQQRGASIQQKYICEKVFDLLKEAWNKFNSEER